MRAKTGQVARSAEGESNRFEREFECLYEGEVRRYCLELRRVDLLKTL